MIPYLDPSPSCIFWCRRCSVLLCKDDTSLVHVGGLNTAPLVQLRKEYQDEKRVILYLDLSPFLRNLEWRMRRHPLHGWYLYRVSRESVTWEPRFRPCSRNITNAWRRSQNTRVWDIWSISRSSLVSLHFDVQTYSLDPISTVLIYILQLAQTFTKQTEFLDLRISCGVDRIIQFGI